MCVQVITEKRQRFNGVDYYLCGQYYQKKGKRLHREVWEHFNGAIPDGFHVHHIDGNRSNNDITNLDLKTEFEHMSGHAESPERKEYGKMQIKRIRPLASLWHGSEKGKEWHSERGKKNWENKPEKKQACSFCGNEFLSRHDYAADENRFCHQNCRAAFRRRRLRAVCV